MIVTFRQYCFTYFPPFSSKVVVYSRIYEMGRSFIEYNRFALFDRIPSFKQIFFRTKNDEKIFLTFCKR